MDPSLVGGIRFHATLPGSLILGWQGTLYEPPQGVVRHLACPPIQCCPVTQLHEPYSSPEGIPIEANAL